MIWECKVAVGANNIPRVMQTQAKSYLEAKAFFETFGKLLNDPRMISEAK